MELRWLQDFLTVAETGNFTRAAEKRNTSQAAFSRRIKSLEAWLGFDVIDRSVYPTQLTPQGERFREHAGELLRQMLDARIELGGKPLHRHAHIRIALPFALATALSERLATKQDMSLPGRATHPVPLLMYSPGVYFARLVDLILESAPVFGTRIIESDMFDVLRDMAFTGRGVAWLPDSTVAAAGRNGLKAIGRDKWALPLSLVAFKDRMNDWRSLNLFWSELCKRNIDHIAAGHGRPSARSLARPVAKSAR
jgi:DNA-binding transcriptional LysR family regulator